MARDNATFLYNGIGNIGDVQLTNWKGKAVIKRRRRHVEQPGTLAQLCTWAILRTASKLSKLIKPTVLLGFKLACAQDMTEGNKFMSANKDIFSCVDGKEVTIDFLGLVVSSGNLVGLRSGAKAVTNANALELTLGTYVTGEGSPTDKLAIVIVDKTNKLALNLGDVTTRDQSSSTINVPPAMSGTKYCYGFYYNPLNSQVSASMMLDIT
jgi:hypothetical protein